MKTTIISVLLLLAATAWADTTGVQAVPSDQIKYPDASEILNKTDPDAKAKTAEAKTDAKTGLPVNKLVTAKPVPALAVPAATATAAAKAPAPGTGWYLKWSLADEASARSWASSLGVAADVSADGAQWQVVAGPLTGDSLKLLSNQTGKAVLIHR
jgi:hypothetical protein